MKYKLNKGKHSNYEIVLNLDSADMEKARQSVLKNFQKDFEAPGFRKGHVPMNMVESQIKPDYLKLGIYEEAIHNGLDVVINENTDIKFIGQIYDLNQKEEKDGLELTFKLDIYPEVEVLNDNWNTFEVKEIDDSSKEDEIEEAIMNLKRQYAEYKESDKIVEGSVFKARFEYKDAKGEVLDKGSVILGKEELEEFPELKTLFVGRENKKKFEIDYDKKLPTLIAYKKDRKIPKTMEFEIMDVREVVLPDFTAENILKYFGNEGVKTIEELKSKISEIMQQQKRQMLLVQFVEDFIKAAEASIRVVVPKTIIDEEFKTRYKSFEQRLGGSDKLKEYFEKLGKENSEKTIKDIMSSAEESLVKFFKFRKLTELLDIESTIDWNKSMDAEEKTYARLIQGVASKPKKETKPAKKTKK